MKLLTAVVAPSRLKPITTALDGAGLTVTTVATAQASGMGAAANQRYKGVEYHDQRCVRLEVLIHEVDLDRAVALVLAIDDEASGDIVVWVSEVAEPSRVRAREFVSQS